MSRHRYVIEEAAVESFYRLPLRHRERLLDIFSQLTQEVHVPGENAFRDQADRWILRKELSGWKVWYWVDGPVYEVRIVAVAKRGR
jgi:hypothetical protein